VCITIVVTCFVLDSYELDCGHLLQEQAECLRRLAFYVFH
jgi:hypothetical protein